MSAIQRSDKEWRKYIKIMTGCALRFGLTVEDAKDFAMWRIERLLNGICVKQPTKYALIDYHRELIGFSRTTKKSKKDLFRNVTVETGSNDNNYQNCEVREIYKKIFNCVRKRFGTKYLILVKLLFKDDLLFREAGEVLGISESRVSQMYKEIRKVLPPTRQAFLESL